MIRLPFYSNLARVWGVGVGVVPKWLVDLGQSVTGADWAVRDYGPEIDAGDKLEEMRGKVVMEATQSI